jgi:epoxyqueuosine reductase
MPFMDMQLFARENNCIIGVCKPDRMPDREAPFLSANKEKRADPKAILPEARSIIVLGAGYDPPVYQNLSALATNADYHPVIKGLLKKLAGLLPSHTYKILADSPFLDERALAVKAGLGFYGKNGLVIAPGLGSFFNIGCMLTDLVLPITPPQAYEGCPEGCLRCLEACPVQFKKSRCISYLTQKECLNEEEKTLIRGQLYGCDLCQTVCPFNGITPPQAVYPPSDWLNLSDAELEAEYGHTAMWWRGVTTMRRNAACNLPPKPFQ